MRCSLSTTLIAVTTLVTIKNIGVFGDKVGSCNVDDTLDRIEPYPLCSTKVVDLCIISGDIHVCTFDDVKHHFQPSAQEPYWYVKGFNIVDNTLLGHGLPFDVIGIHKECNGIHTCLDYFVIQTWVVGHGDATDIGDVTNRIKIETPTITQTRISQLDENGDEIDGRVIFYDSETLNTDPRQIGDFIDMYDNSFGTWNCESLDDPLRIRCSINWEALIGTCSECDDDEDVVIELIYQSADANIGKIWVSDVFVDRVAGLCGTFDNDRNNSICAIPQLESPLPYRRLASQGINSVNSVDSINETKEGESLSRQLLYSPLSKPQVSFVNWAGFQSMLTMSESVQERADEFGNSWVAGDSFMGRRRLVSLLTFGCGVYGQGIRNFFRALKRVRKAHAVASEYCGMIWNMEDVSNCLECDDDIPADIEETAFVNDCISSVCASAFSGDDRIDQISFDDALNRGYLEIPINECAVHCLPDDTLSPTEEPTEQPSEEPTRMPSEEFMGGGGGPGGGGPGAGGPPVP